MELHKGMRVRVLHTDYDQIPVGTVTHIVKVDDEDAWLWCERFPEGLYFYSHEFEPVPKFKVGDRVAFVDDYSSSARGTEATVVSVDGWGIMVNGVYGKSTEAPSSLRLVAPATSGKRETLGDILAAALATSTPAIVALIENGQPKPAARPFVHSDREDATKEAKRLADKHKGHEFGVYELVDMAKEDKVYEHEWQRLAVEGHKIEAIKAIRAAAGLHLATARRAVEDWLAREAA